MILEINSFMISVETPEPPAAINSEYWNQNRVTKLNFGEVEFTIESGKDYAKTAYGRVTKEEIRKAIEYIEKPWLSVLE